MNDQNHIENILEKAEEISEDIQPLALDDDKVALHDIVRISKWVRNNFSKLLVGIITFIIVLVSYTFYSLDFKDDTKETLTSIKQEISILKKDIHDYNKYTQIISVNEANIKSLEHRINELKKVHDVGTRLYKLEYKEDK